jgi:hypothetical protein
MSLFACNFTSVKYLLDPELIEGLRSLLRQPLIQVDFEKVIPSGKVGTLPLTIWAGDKAVTIAYGSDEFPISPFDHYPLSDLQSSPNPSELAKGSDRLVYLKGQPLQQIDIVRTRVRGFYRSKQFLDIEMDLSLILRSERGFIALQRTYLDDFAVDIQRGTEHDEVVLVAPDFSGETDLEYRYDVQLEIIPLS